MVCSSVTMFAGPSVGPLVSLLPPMTIYWLCFTFNYCALSVLRQKFQLESFKVGPKDIRSSMKVRTVFDEKVT